MDIDNKTSVITVQALVDSDTKLRYLNAGFADTGNSDFSGKILLTRNLYSKKERVGRTLHIERKVPWLVQRGSINRPLGAHEGLPLSKAVSMDYMGSSYFEGMESSNSLRRLQSVESLCKVHKVENIFREEAGKKFILRVFGNFDDEQQFQQYVEWLMLMRDDKLNLEEPSYFEDTESTKAFRHRTSIDFWWDLENDVIFSFDKNFMNRVACHLQASFAVLNGDSK